MGRLRLHKSRWKGAKLRMKLVEFKPNEGDLYEALSVIFFGADGPSPKELKASIKSEDTIEAAGIEIKDSKFKLSQCPFCRQRNSINPRIYTLPEGKGADLILEDRIFDYIHARFDAWQMIPDAKLKRPFAELQDRLDAAKSNKELDDITKINEYLRKRDSAVSSM